MSRWKRKKKTDKPKLQGIKADLVVIDELSTTEPGLWADPKPRFSNTKAHEPTEEPETIGFEYAKGGIISKNPMGSFMGVFDGLNPDHLSSAFAGISKSAHISAEQIQKVGRITRNMGRPTPVEPPVTVNVLNNLCEEVELPTKKLSVDDHRDFIRKMMETALNSGIKSMYYTKPSQTPKPKEETE